MLRGVISPWLRAGIAFALGGSVTDEELMVAVAAGSRDALGYLYDRHAPGLLSIGLRLLRERADAEEVLHDVVLEAWQRAGDYDPERGSVQSWLGTRMRSRSIDRLKSPGRASVIAAGTLEHVADDRSGAERMADRMVDARRVRDKLACLPAEQQRVVVLGYFAGLSFSGVARRLGVPLGTVKSRMHAALTKLRAELVPLPHGV